MVKWFIVLVAIIGALHLINAIVPEAWVTGFNIQGRMIPWGICFLGGFIILAAGLKSK